MASFIDLTGHSYGSLRVIKRVENSSSNRVRWECICICEKTYIAYASELRSGHTRSCGCSKHLTKTQLPSYIEEIESVLGARLVPLTQGAFAIVDHDDYDRVMNYSWTLHSAGYAIGWIEHGVERRKEFMHRFILNAGKGQEVDHKEINAKRDNRRSNIRLCTSEQNKGNRKQRSTSKQPYKGVEYAPQLIWPWIAYIGHKSKKTYLGNFATAEEAAEEYNHAAIKKFGEFAYLNEVRR